MAGRVLWQEGCCDWLFNVVFFMIVIVIVIHLLGVN